MPLLRSDVSTVRSLMVDSLSYVSFTTGIDNKKKRSYIYLYLCKAQVHCTDSGMMHIKLVTHNSHMYIPVKLAFEFPRPTFKLY